MKISELLNIRQNIRRPTSLFLFLTFVIITGTLIVATTGLRTFFPAGKLAWSYASVSGGQLPRDFIEDEMFGRLQKNPGDEDAVRAIFEAQKNPDWAGEGGMGPEGFNNPELLKVAYKKVIEITSLPEQTVQGWFQYEIYGADTALEYLGKSKWNDRNPMQAGVILYEEARYREALNYFSRAMKLKPDDDLAKRYFLYTELELDSAEFEKLIREPQYSGLVDNGLMTSYYLKKNDYAGMAQHLLAYEFEEYSLSAVLVSIVTGLGWVIFILQMGYFKYWPLKYKLMTVPALLLGVLSAFVTLIVVTIQDHALGFDESPPQTFFRALAFYTAGVGLREELIKLAFFVPIAWLVRKRKEQLMILSLASMVGLGFAIEENIYYYVEFSGFPVVSRFLTANFFHIAMTGYCGYFLVRAMQQGGDTWVDFVIQTLLMIFIHGLYDFLLSSDTDGVMAFLAMAGFIIVTRRYMKVFLALNPGIPYRISLPFIFVCALSVTIGMGYYLVTDYLELVSASLMLLLNSLSGVIFIVYMFFYEMRSFVDRNVPDKDA